jgi:hypothetical protein
MAPRFRIALRVGGAAALGYLLVELLNGHVGGDRARLALMVAEVWAIAAILWLAIGAGRR